MNAQSARVAMLLAAAAVGPGPVAAQSITAEAAAEVRWFPEAPLFADQRGVRVSPSFTLEPELALDWGDGAYQFTLRPFARLDAHDDHRTHIDLREASISRLGDNWSLTVGLDRVFWGVTEVNHLIDIVNQTDAVEDLDGEDKLGQPLVNLTMEGGWGALDLYWLPYFRERTFPDGRARLRGPFPVADKASYESGAGRWHQDVAARWSRVLGSVDLGVSFFRGTSREPGLRPFNPQVAEGQAPSDGLLRLQPHYAVIDQAAVDLQWTGDRALWKVEAMTRGGHGNRFYAVSGGLEYTLYQVGSGSSDLGLLAEVMVDGRGEEAPPTLFDNDAFVGARWALNDVDDTAVLAGVVVDWERGETFALVEAERRLSGDWKMELQARLLGNTDPGSFVAGIRRDSFLTLRVGRYW